ncbi:unnamed protein product, partial [Laminaria digitata]
ISHACLAARVLLVERDARRVTAKLPQATAVKAVALKSLCIGTSAGVLGSLV